MRPCIDPLESRVLLSAGFADPTFNGTGKVVTHYRDTNDAVAVALQTDAGLTKEVVVGDAQTKGAGKDAFVSRFNPDGSVDPSFGTNGVTFLDLGADEIATGVSIQPADQKIVVCGVTGHLSSLQGTGWVRAYNTDGTLDTSFNSTGATPGVRIIDWGGLNGAADVLALSGNGNIVVVGSEVSGLAGGAAIAEFNPDGSFFTSFGGNGMAVMTGGAGVINGGTSVVLSQGHFVVGGFSANAITHKVTFSLFYFNPDLSTAIHFGNNGESDASFGRGVELALGVKATSDGHIIAAGTTADGLIDLPAGFVDTLPASHAKVADFAVARFNPDGTLDTSFNSTGMATVNFKTGSANNLDGASDVAIQSDGKIVASGGTQTLATGQGDFAAARWNTDGTLDTTFGTAGLSRVDFGASDGSFGMVETSDDRAIEVGHTKINAGSGSVAILALTNDASPVTGPMADVGIASMTTSKFPRTLVGGQPNAKGLVVVTVVDTGDLDCNGPVTITLFSSADQTLDGSDTQLTPSPITRTVHLKHGKSTKIIVAVKFSDVAIDSDLFILGTISGTGVPASPPTGSTSATLHVEHAVINITGSGTPQALKVVHYNRKVPLNVPLTNTGNVAAKGTASFDLVISTDQTADLGSVVGNSSILNQPLFIGPGKRLNKRLNFSAPASAVDLAPGDYFILVRLATSSFTPANSNDGAIVAIIPITIS